MKKVIDNKEADIFELKAKKDDIIEIILIENAKIVDKKTEKEYFNSNFMLIRNRKNVFRILDLDSNIDITNIFKRFELVYSKKTTEKVVFRGQ